MTPRENLEKRAKKVGVPVNRKKISELLYKCDSMTGVEVVEKLKAFCLNDNLQLEDVVVEFGVTYDYDDCHAELILYGFVAKTDEELLQEVLLAEECQEKQNKEKATKEKAKFAKLEKEYLKMKKKWGNK